MAAIVGYILDERFSDPAHGREAIRAELGHELVAHGSDAATAASRPHTTW
jgi:hypothetical protein